MHCYIFKGITTFALVMFLNLCSPKIFIKMYSLTKTLKCNFSSPLIIFTSFPLSVLRAHAILMWVNAKAKQYHFFFQFSITISLRIHHKCYKNKQETTLTCNWKDQKSYRLSLAWDTAFIFIVIFSSISDWHYSHH